MYFKSPHYNFWPLEAMPNEQGKLPGEPTYKIFVNFEKFQGFPVGAVVKKPPANAGDTGSSPGPGRSHMPRSN